MIELDQEYDKIKNSITSYERVNILNSIIEIKTASNQLTYLRSIFEDERLFFKNYIDAIEEQKYGYYTLTKKIVDEKIEILSINDQIAILNYLNRLLKRAGFESEYKWVEELINIKRIQKYKSKKSIPNFFKIIFTYSTLNLKWLLFSFTLLYLIYFVILLPAPIKQFELFRTDYVAYKVGDFYFNHLLNTLLSFFQIESDFKVFPINIIGIVLLIFNKLVVVTLFVKFFSEEIKKRLG